MTKGNENSNEEAAKNREEKLLELVKEDIKSTETARSRMRTRVEELDRMWKGERTRKTYVGRSNVVIPFPYWYAESMIPRLMASIFGGRDIVEVLPRGNGTLLGARAHKALINYQLLFEMEAFVKLLHFCQSVIRKQMGVAKIRWDAQKRAPQWHNINVEDFASDPSAPVLSEKRWMGHVVTKTKEELARGVIERGYDPEAVEAIIAKNPETMVGSGIDRVEVSKERGTYRLWEWWGDFAMDADGSQPLIVLMGEDKLVKWIKSPYKGLKPFIAVQDVVDPRQFEGHSEMKPIEGLWNITSDLLNQRVDNVSLGINRLWTILRGANVRRDKLISVPWGVIDVDAHEDIKDWAPKDVTNQAYGEVSQLMGIMKDTTGLIDQLRGVDKPSSDTATAFQGIVAQANLRPGLKVQVMQYMGIMRMAQIMIAENRMFLDANKAILIVGEANAAKAAMDVSPEMIQGEYDVLPLGVALAGSRDMRIGQLINGLNVLRGYEQQGLNIFPIVREMVGLLEVRNGEQVTAGWEKRLEEQEAMQQRAMRMRELVQAGVLPSPQPAGAPMGMPGQVNMPGVPPMGMQTPAGGAVGGPLR